MTEMSLLQFIALTLLVLLCHSVDAHDFPSESSGSGLDYFNYQPEWTLLQYFSNVIAENDVGGVVFDATNKCLPEPHSHSPVEPSLEVSLRYCPISQGHEYFVTNPNK